MNIRFCGGAQNVTGSQYLVEVNKQRVLVDCGLFQGRREESYERNENFLYDPATLNAVLVTHAHMDHSGNLPNLVKQGYKGPIHATEPTVELCTFMLKDSAHLQERDIFWVNKIRAKHHEPPMHVLYNQRDVERTLDHFNPVEYDTTIDVADGVKATFRNAGHIMGSSGIVLEITEGSQTKRVGFAMDVGRTNIPLEPDPNALRNLDVLLMESTYGNRQHGSFEEVDDELAAVINEVAAGGGKIIIPSFAVGRTQLMVYLLHQLFNQNRIPDMPVFVDSPMASEATEVYRRHIENLDREASRTFARDGQDPFGFGRLKYIRDVNESKALNGIAYPHIIISSSGMCEGGRILHHLRNNIGDRRNAVLFVGYAARHTLARKLVEGDKTVKIFGEEHTVRCQVKVMHGFSAHADRRGLLDYVKMTPPSKLKHIFLVHGEEDQAIPLKDGIRSMGYPDVRYPEFGETVEI